MQQQLGQAVTFFSKLRGLPVEQLPWSVRAKASRSLLLGFARFPLFSFFFLRRFAELSRPNPQRRGGKKYLRKMKKKKLASELFSPQNGGFLFWFHPQEERKKLLQR
jgi:hypothetical protein